MGNKTGDHNEVNNLNSNLMNSFLRNTNMHIANSNYRRGEYTYERRGKKSIIDLCISQNPTKDMKNLTIDHHIMFTGDHKPITVQSHVKCQITSIQPIYRIGTKSTCNKNLKNHIHSQTVAMMSQIRKGIRKASKQPHTQKDREMFSHLATIMAIYAMMRALIKTHGITTLTGHKKWHNTSQKLIDINTRLYNEPENHKELCKDFYRQLFHEQQQLAMYNANYLENNPIHEKQKFLKKQYNQAKNTNVQTHLTYKDTEMPTNEALYHFYHEQMTEVYQQPKEIQEALNIINQHSADEVKIKKRRRRRSYGPNEFERCSWV